MYESHTPPSQTKLAPVLNPSHSLSSRPRYNCIALVNTCRDEVCRPLAAYIDKEFGLSFNISGLGGLVNCGKTGFKAGFSHSPVFPCDKDGKPRERCERLTGRGDRGA